MTLRAKIVIAAMGLTLIAGCFIVSKVLDVYDYPVVAAKLPAAMKEAQAAGVPLTADEFKPKSNDPDSENVSRLLATFKDFGPNGWSTPYRNLSEPAPDWPAAHRMLTANASKLDELRAAFRTPPGILDRDWDMFPFLPFPEFSSSKAAASALCMSALVKSHDHQFEVAARDLALARNIGVYLGRQPLLIGLLIQRAVDATVNATTVYCLNDAADSPVGLKAIRTAALDSAPKYDLRWALRGEAYCGVVTTRNLNQFGGLKSVLEPDFNENKTPVVPDPKTILRSGAPTGLDEKAYMVRVLQYWTRIFRFMDAHPDDLIGLASFGKRLDQELVANQAHMSWAILVILMPFVDQSALTCMSGTADVRCKLALERVLEFRAKNGHYPNSLDEAGINLADPFDGKPLRYRMSGGSIRIWSIGQNMKDDGGLTRFESKDLQNFVWDEVTTYPPVRSLRKF